MTPKEELNNPKHPENLLTNERYSVHYVYVSHAGKDHPVYLLGRFQRMASIDGGLSLIFINAVNVAVVVPWKWVRQIERIKS